jgi:hypothetical protein
VGIPHSVSRSTAAEAHAVIDEFPDGSPWRLPAPAVRSRLHELVDRPTRLRQGPLNLCGPAAVCLLWLRRDPVAAVRFASELFAQGSARIGSLTVRPSSGLLAGQPPFGVAAADFLLLASLRDSANRVLAYRPAGRLWEAAAGITLPGAVSRWLREIDVHSSVRDETRLVRPAGLDHALHLAAGPETDVLALVARSLLARRRVAWVPDHWIVLRGPVVQTGSSVRLRYWSWGAVHSAELDRDRFARGYFGAVTASTAG